MLFYCLYIPHFLIDSSVEDTGCFYFWATLNNDVVNLCLWATDFIDFGYIPKSGIAGSYGRSIFYLFFRKLHSISHNAHNKTIIVKRLRLSTVELMFMFHTSLPILSYVSLGKLINLFKIGPTQGIR